VNSEIRVLVVDADLHVVAAVADLAVEMGSHVASLFAFCYRPVLRKNSRPRKRS
jgi:hypothetical protein